MATLDIPVRELVYSILSFCEFGKLMQCRSLSRDANKQIERHLAIHWMHLRYTAKQICHWYCILSFRTMSPRKLDLCDWSELVKVACLYANKDVLTKLHHLDSSAFTEQTVYDAIHSGKTEFLRWFNNNDKSKGLGVFHHWGLNHIHVAARNGNLEMVQYLRNPLKVGGMCPWDHYTFSSAVESGNLDLVIWLRKPKGVGICPWTSYATQVASRKGHLHILKWLRDPMCHCPQWKGANIRCTSSGPFLSLTWDSKTTPCPWDNCHVRMHDNELIFVPRSLQESKKCPTQKIATLETRYAGVRPPVSDMHQTDKSNQIWTEFVCEWHPECVIEAVEQGHFDVFQYLIKAGCPWNSQYVLNSLLKHQRGNMLTWIWQNFDFSCDFWPKTTSFLDSNLHSQADEDAETDHFLFEQISNATRKYN
jgi:hypothetical protein